MANAGDVTIMPSGILVSAGKIGSLLALVALTFFSALIFGYSADGHNLYSPDHRIWREAVEALMDPTLSLGGLAMWIFALFGGRRNWTAGHVLARAAFAVVASLCLMQVDLFNTPLIAFVVGGSVAAICFAGRHSWAMLFAASAPYLVWILAIIAFFTLAPPDTGPIGP